MLRINLLRIRNGFGSSGSAPRAQTAPRGELMRNGGRHSDEEEEDSPRARLRTVAKHLAEELQDYARRKPLEGLIISLLTGMVIGGLLRRDR